MAIKLLFLDQIYFGKILSTSLNHDIVMYKYGKRKKNFVWYRKLSKIC